MTAISTDPSPSERPVLLAGPLLRRVLAQRIQWWLACTRPVRVRVTLEPDGGDASCHEPAQRCLRAGARLFFVLVDLQLDTALVAGRWTGYRLALRGADGPDDEELPLDLAPLCYAGRDTPGFVFAPEVRTLLHGSCRKPHYAGDHASGNHAAGGGDGLLRADQQIEQLLAQNDFQRWPSALMLTGDQVYCDDVAGPMLRAIHTLMRALGLPDETIAGAEKSGLRSATDLLMHPAGYYRREQLLPRTPHTAQLIDYLFGGVDKPVFTTDSAHNHLVALGEVLAMYLLVWSPLPWQGLDLAPPAELDPRWRALYARERAALDNFRQGLVAVRRVLAHLPVAMVCDDHDITDDWNLSSEWEKLAYGHPFSRRVVGNALVGYLINQAWGNCAEAFDQALLGQAQAALDAPGGPAHEALIDRLLQWPGWHYAWPTEPPLMVLDSRTQRWHSDTSPRLPSGLMDWEALTDLQQALRGHPAVLLVSPAPIFGVKLIETIQRIFSYAGRPLMVDAENWMSHPGAAAAVLNIFRHPRTPHTFVVLSGDVHYSFAFDVELRPRGRRSVQGPHIWQICSSGLRNTFPERLLALLDLLNRWLYAPRSPLNLFTRRRHMKVTPRKPRDARHGRRLLNGSGIGLVEFDRDGRPTRIAQLLCDGRDVEFDVSEGDARED